MPVRLWLSGAAVLVLVAVAVASVTGSNGGEATTEEEAAAQPATEAEQYSAVNPPTARPATKKPAAETTGAIIERTDVIAKAEAGELGPGDPAESTKAMEKAVAEHPEWGECFGHAKLPEYDEDGHRLSPDERQAPGLSQYHCATGPPKARVIR